MVVNLQLYSLCNYACPGTTESFSSWGQSTITMSVKTASLVLSISEHDGYRSVKGGSIHTIGFHLQNSKQLLTTKILVPSFQPTTNGLKTNTEMKA